MSDKLKRVKISVLKTDIKKGARRDPESCPVARALIRAGFDNPDVGADDFMTDSAIFPIDLPKKVANFIEAFDGSTNRSLIKPIEFTILISAEDFADLNKKGKK